MVNSQPALFCIVEMAILKRERPAWFALDTPIVFREFMSIRFRRATPSDVATCIDIRGKTRDNAIPASYLAELGVTEASWSALVASNKLPGYICEFNNQIAGYCFGSAETGEVVVLALLPAYENQGIGKALLHRVMAELHARGHNRLFLGCSDDPRIRSYGFYRHLGWRSTGTRDKYGDEVLEYVFPLRPDRQA